MKRSVPGSFTRLDTKRFEEGKREEGKREPPKKRAKKTADDFDEVVNAQAQWSSLKETLDKNKIDPQSLPDLEEFDPSILPSDPFIILEGRRRSGKSIFARWMLQWFVGEFSLVWCMTNTESIGYWQEFVGDKYTFPKWSPGAIEALFDRQDKMIETYGENNKEAHHLGAALLILDDIIDRKFHDDDVIAKLATLGRHKWITVVLATQYPKRISTDLRENADAIVIFNQKTDRSKQSLWEDFMNDTTKDMSRAMIERFCQEHDALVSLQTVLSSDIYKCFRKSTVDKMHLAHPDYALGDDEQIRSIMKYREERRKLEEKQKRNTRDALARRKGSSSKFTYDQIEK